MINSFKNPAIMRILRTTERYEAGWREQNFIPHDETAGLRAGERLQAAPEIAGAAFLIPLTAAGTWGREDPGEDGNGTLKNYEGAYAKWITSC